MVDIDRSRRVDHRNQVTVDIQHDAGNNAIQMEHSLTSWNRPYMDGLFNAVTRRCTGVEVAKLIVKHSLSAR